MIQEMPNTVESWAAIGLRDGIKKTARLFTNLTDPRFSLLPEETQRKLIRLGLLRSLAWVNGDFAEAVRFHAEGEAVISAIRAEEETT